MPSFALVTEGPTDQIIIKNILSGYYDDPDIRVRRLLPLGDETDDTRILSNSNWLEVLKYCSSTEFRKALQFSDYIIIQIDTDVSQEKGFGVKHHDADGAELSCEQLIEDVKTDLKARIGDEFCQRYADRILFAISVHSIECWLLPLHEPDGRKAKKVKNCLDSLNLVWKTKGFTIDRENKSLDRYDDVSRDYMKHKTLMKLYKVNPSLLAFIQELEKTRATASKIGLVGCF